MMQEFLCNVVLQVCFGVASSAGLFCLSRDQGGGGAGCSGVPGMAGGVFVVAHG